MPLLQSRGAILIRQAGSPAQGAFITNNAQASFQCKSLRPKGMTMTEKLYIKDAYLKEAQMTLLQLEDSPNGIRAAFDRSPFYPEGGGQLCDTGTIGGVRVLDVREDKQTGIVWHSLNPEHACELEPGRSYTGIIDWKKRFTHMQLHSGEHILSGAMIKLYGIENKGFHMGEEYTTIDVDLRPDSPYTEITEEMIQVCEQTANEYIWLDAPVNTYFFDTAEDALSLPCRKKIKYGEDISVVLMGDVQDPVDCCACCGTHVRRTGEVGLIKITHAEKYKGMHRFYVKSGITAYEDYCTKQDVADGLGRRFSCDPRDLEKALDAADLRNQDLFRKYSQLKSLFMAQAESSLREALAKPFEGSLRIFRYTDLSADDLQTLARKLSKDITGPVALAAVSEHCAVLTSPGTPDCGKLVKENAPIYQGKGGGKPDLARAIFKDDEGLELYLDLIEKHLR